MLADERLRVGRRVGNYILQEKLGQGAFGEVWRAVHHERPGRVVAVKVATNPDSQRQLSREGRLPDIDHPNVVPILDADTRFADLPYIVMPYYPGGSLTELIGQHPGGLPEERVDEILRGILGGLAAAQERGILHRDIKPSNILLADGGRALICDFGLSRLGAGGQASDAILQSASLERDQSVLVGTTAYMAPEVRDGGECTAASDVYAVGVVLFEMLTGRRPQGIEHPSHVRAALSESARWDDLFLRACAGPDRRYSGPGDMLRALVEAPAKLCYERAEAYCERGEYDLAIAEYTQAIRLDPEYGEAYRSRGVTWAKKGNYDGAIADCDEAVRLSPSDAAPYRCRATARYMKGDYDRAILDCGEAIRLSPNDSRTYNIRALAHFMEGDYDRAILDCGEAIRLSPDNGVLYMTRGLVRLKGARRDEAVGDAAFCSDRPDQDAYDQARAGRDRAVADLDRAVGLMPHSARAYLERARAYCQNDITDGRAIGDCTEAIRLKPDYVDAYLWRAGIFVCRARCGWGGHEHAVADYTAAIRLSPDRAHLYVARAEVYSDHGEHERAVADCTAAIRLGPDNGHLYWRRADVYAAKGDYDSAVADDDRGVRLMADGAEAWCVRAGQYRGKWFDLERGYNDPGKWKYRWYHDRAIACCTQAVRMRPDYGEAYALRAKAYEQEKNDELAIADYGHLLRLNPANAEARHSRACLYANNGDYARALADCDEAIRLNHDQAEAFWERGYIYEEMGDLDRAIADYSQSIRLKPDDASSYRWRAHAHEQKGDQERAITDYRKVVELDPEGRGEGRLAREALSELGVHMGSDETLRASD